jgi:hypothetical protein
VIALVGLSIWITLVYTTGTVSPLAAALLGIGSLVGYGLALAVR